MRRFLVAFAVCVAVATASLLDDDFNSYDEEQNNVGIFSKFHFSQLLHRAALNFTITYTQG